MFGAGSDDKNVKSEDEKMDDKSEENSEVIDDLF
jgi:hypothetical protein